MQKADMKADEPSIEIRDRNRKNSWQQFQLEKEGCKTRELLACFSLQNWKQKIKIKKIVKQQLILGLLHLIIEQSQLIII